MQGPLLAQSGRWQMWRGQLRVNRSTLTVGQPLPTLPQLRTCRCTAPTYAMCHERTSAVVPKNIPESLTLRMLYPAFLQERQEDIGPLG
jgi:hypothetical protein